MSIRSALLSRLVIYAFFIFINTLAFSAHAEPIKSNLHDHKQLIKTAKQFLVDNVQTKQYTRVDIQMNNLDPRLRLSQCEIPLTSTLAPGSQFAGKTTVHIRCNSSTPWTVYVGAKIKLFGNIVQSQKPLTKGHILKREDLILAERNLSRIKHGYYTSMDALIGKQLKRRIAQDKIIKANYVKSPTLIKRGELVSIVAGNSHYSVKMSGTALGSGARGDRIRVKNSSSKRIIEGIIREAGVVSIN